MGDTDEEKSHRAVSWRVFELLMMDTHQSLTVRRPSAFPQLPDLMLKATQRSHQPYFTDEEAEVLGHLGDE